VHLKDSSSNAQREDREVDFEESINIVGTYLALNTFDGSRSQIIQKVPLPPVLRQRDCFADVELEKAIDSRAITGLFSVETHQRSMPAVHNLWPGRFGSLVVARIRLLGRVSSMSPGL
jgi:hypothetical protein